MFLRTFFSGGDIDRQSWRRADAELLEQKLCSPAARFVVTFQSGCLIESDSALLLNREEIEVLPGTESTIYLGNRGEHDIFVVDLPDDFAEADATFSSVASFKGILSNLPERDAALLAYAKGMVEWQRRHKFCGVCGAPNESVYGGNILQCSSSDCSHRNFPRVDPAIIVLTINNESCLLGRQLSWPEGRFSTLAGFVEPGEALEDAVEREVYEETSVHISSSTYLGSQPWPFPSSLMIGFHAQADTTDIRLLDGELAEAHWFDRDMIASGSIKLPPPTSIAYRLIERWFDSGNTESLASLDVCSSFKSSAE